MFSFLSRFFRRFYYDDQDDEPIEWNEDVLQNGNCTDQMEENPPNIKNVDEESLECVRRTGVITSVSADYGLIDNFWYFDMSVAPQSFKLEIGATVSFLAYRANPNESERVLRIEICEESSWECDQAMIESPPKNGEEPSKLNLNDDGVQIVGSMKRVLNGKVTSREGRKLLIEPLNIWCNLDVIKSEFIPIKGDWVSLEAEVSLDQQSANLAGEILDVKYLKPLMVRNSKGTITFIKKLRNSSYEGIIEHEIYFAKDHCEINFVPRLGDSVFYKALESSQGKQKWRALSIQPTFEAEVRTHAFENKSLLENKNGIVILGATDFETLEMGEVKELTLEVRNMGDKAQTFLRGGFCTGKSSSQVKLKTPNHSGTIVIEPANILKFVFSCEAKFLGVSAELFIFYFKDFQLGKYFKVNVTVTKQNNKILPCNLKTVAIESTQMKYSWESFNRSNALYGHQRLLKSRFNRGRKVMNFKVPEKLFQIMIGDADNNTSRQHIKEMIMDFAPSLANELSIASYKDKFHALLYLEEISEKVKFRKYDMANVILQKKDQYLTLDVSDVVDSKNVFTVGTSVLVTQPWSEVSTVKQIGFVHEIRENEILIRFHNSFHSEYNQTVCNVSFEPSRTGFLRCHMAIDTAVIRLGESWLFPSSVIERPPVLKLRFDEDIFDDFVPSEFDCDIDENGFAIPKSQNRDSPRTLKWFNKNLNELQRLSVVNALEGRGRPLPYIIYGPPGTGKTVTLLEIILQIYTMLSDSRILIGTPSNSAADLICQLLIDSRLFTPGELVRILSYHRSQERNYPEALIPYCAAVQLELESDLHNNGRMTSINDSIGTQRIIIGTCTTLGNLHDLGLEQGHFSHIIIDEACQATEPEVLIPISFLDPKRGQVILSGDPEQLGPICMNYLSGPCGLRKSLLERLIKQLPYMRDKISYPNTNGYDPRFISRLNVNYRSVPEILNLSSQIFYDSELVPTVSETEGPESAIIRKFDFKSEGSREIPAAFIFHGIRGQNYREDRSTSWYNPLEIWQVICYLKKLYAIGLTPDQVGIITPYQKQVEKVRLLLEALDLPSPKIGSVEEFQGQERFAIILSTVRSSLINVDDNCERMLGFVAFPRRLNVAITRARALLIIIGNPFTLSLDPYWSNVIQYCINNDSYTGCSLGGSFASANAGGGNLPPR